MKSFILLATVFLTFALAGCTSTPNTPSVGCSAEQLVDTAAVGVLTAIDGCSNTAQMQTDIQALWDKANLCTAAAVQADAKKALVAHRAFVAAHPLGGKLKAAGPIADIVCPIVVNSVDGLIGSKAPASWQCTGSTSIDTALTAACDLLPF